MPYTLAQPEKKNPSSYVIFKNILSKTECRELIEYGQTIPAEAGKIATAKEKRISEIRWLHYQPALENTFQKLSDIVLMANEKWWNFHLAGFYEPLQLTHYKAENGGKYDFHADLSDVGPGQNRKISGTLLLNDNFEGGEFELFDTPPIEKMNRGDIILFPSFKVHRVNPVTQGERYSLVFWVTGPAWV